MPQFRGALKTDATINAAKIFIEGHGCSASLADTEIMRGLVEHEGYELVESEDQADLSVLVTCTVKSVTEQRMLSRIRELSIGSRKVVVAGCLPKADPEKVRVIDRGMSMIGPGNLDGLLPTIRSTLQGETLVSLQPKKLVKTGMPRNRFNKTIGIVEISSGCLSSCTFCQVKLVKGVVFSYPENEIVDEARRFISEGAREIWLTSTDNAAYGRDSKTSLPSLIRKVCALDGDFKVRIGMMNPLITDRIFEELIDCLKDEKVFKFVHLPVQSGSDRILLEMQRGYTVNEFESTVARLRKEIPELTLSTDFIVGFPTESDSEFEESMRLVERTRPDVLNLSRFGARSGTKAAVMSGQISPEEAKRRSRIMTEAARRIQNQTNARWVGWRGTALVDEKVRGAFVARNFAYKPCLVKEPQNERIDFLLGKDVALEIVASTAATLHAVLV
jgi:threonylcarbamoyladenosine tRNA methylthiotransferase CDKAL1